MTRVPLACQESVHDRTADKNTLVTDVTWKIRFDPEAVADSLVPLLHLNFALFTVVYYHNSRDINSSGTGTTVRRLKKEYLLKEISTNKKDRSTVINSAG